MTQPPPSPRAFPFSAAPFGVRFMLLFGTIWAFVGLSVSAAFMGLGGPPWVDWILDSRGVTGDAAVLKVAPTSTSVNGRPLYDLTVRAEQTEFHVSTAEPLLITRAQEGATVRITWDPQDHSRVRLEGERASFFGLFSLMPGLFAVIGLALMGMAVTRLVRLRAIYRDGEAAIASVRSVENTSIQQNGQPMFRVKYEFRAGVETASGDYLTPTPPSAGAELWVLYVPGASSKNMPYST